METIKLNTQKIKILLAAIDKGSLTKAGQTLGYTQSYLTQIMKAFEDEVGFPLLVKTNRGVEPTQEAMALLPAMRRLVESEEQFDQEVAELQGLRKGTIRIGTYVSTSVYWVPQIIEYFQNNYPQVVFQIEELGHDEMISGLVDGSLDIALMSCPDNKNSIDFIPILEDPMLIAFPPGHELSKYDYVPVDKLKDYPFIMTYKSYDKDPHRVFEEAGFNPEVRYYSRDVAAAHNQRVPGQLRYPKARTGSQPYAGNRAQSPRVRRSSHKVRDQIHQREYSIRKKTDPPLRGSVFVKLRNYLVLLDYLFLLFFSWSDLLFELICESSGYSEDSNCCDDSYHFIASC